MRRGRDEASAVEVSVAVDVAVEVEVEVEAVVAVATIVSTSVTAVAVVVAVAVALVGVVASDDDCCDMIDMNMMRPDTHSRCDSCIIRVWYVETIVYDVCIC